jgi:hypothetical protein
MKASGASPIEVYRKAMADQVGAIARVRLIRAVFGLSPLEAKEIIAKAEYGEKSLGSHQADLAKSLFP